MHYKTIPNIAFDLKTYLPSLLLYLINVYLVAKEETFYKNLIALFLKQQKLCILVFARVRNARMEDVLENKKISLKHASAVNEIILPLTKVLNVPGFSYIRLYPDGQRIFLSSSHSWIENYFEKNYYEAIGYQKCFHLPSYMLWAHWPQEDKKIVEVIKDAYNNFNYGNALFVTKRQKGYVETFTIRGHARDEAVNNRYLQYLGNIDLFLTEFVNKASRLIQESETRKFYVNEKTILPLSDLSLNTFKQQNENNSVQSELLHPSTYKPFLSKRETECILGLALGMTVKGIANTLNLSPRTVETYLENIKNKLSVRLKSQILTELLRCEHNRVILYCKIK